MILEAGGEKESAGRGRGNGPKMPERPDPPVTAIVLAGVGGMLLFLGFFFLLIAAISLGGFFVPAVLVLAIGGAMLAAAWNMWRRTRVKHERMVEKERDRLLCDYCGGQNAEGELQCMFCGAPLR